MYYIATFNQVDESEHAVFEIKVKGVTFCQTQHDSNHSPNDRGTGACSVTQKLMAGKAILNYLRVK